MPSLTVTYVSGLFVTDVSGSYPYFVLVTPTALNSKAQRRQAHAGFPITHTIEPQRGSTRGANGPNWELRMMGGIEKEALSQSFRMRTLRTQNS